MIFYVVDEKVQIYMTRTQLVGTQFWVVGHIPRKMSAVCDLFFRQGGTIYCQGMGGNVFP